MTAIDRTAYPRPGSRLTHEELHARYTLSETDLTFIRLSARGEIGRLMLATLLKARQDVGYFPVTEEVHADTADDRALSRFLYDLGLDPLPIPTAFDDEVDGPSGSVGFV